VLGPEEVVLTAAEVLEPPVVNIIVGVLLIVPITVLGPEEVVLTAAEVLEPPVVNIIVGVLLVVPITVLEPAVKEEPVPGSVTTGLDVELLNPGAV
jgi:hypothetical protein